jgi:hypothetical protein
LKRHLKRCKACEVPLAYSRFLRWFPNGTIVGIDKGRTRLVFMEVDLLNQIIDGISEAIGFDIQRIVVEAERRIGRNFIETLMPGFYESMGLTHMHRTMSLIGPPSQFIFDHVAGLGYGRFMLLSYKHRKRMTVLCRNPYNPGMLMGDSLGVWEFLEQKEGACRGEPQNGMFRINLEESGEPRTHLEGRLVPVNPVYAPGKQNYEICPRCRVPAFIGDTYAWNLDEGIISDRRTGRRVACMPVASLEAALRELEEELGQEIPRLALAITTRVVRDYCAGIGLSTWHDFERQLREISLRGMGVAGVLNNDGSSCSIVLDNPSNPVLMEGILAGSLSNIWNRQVFSRAERQHGSFSYNYRFNA